MPRKRPQPRDIREKEQKIRRKEREARRREFEHVQPRCPHCDKPSIVFHNSDRLGRIIIYCAHCYCGDSLDLKDGAGEDFYYHRFVDNFENSWKVRSKTSNRTIGHYFSGEFYSGGSVEFKEKVMGKLEKIIRQRYAQTHEDKTSIDFHLSILRQFAEKTGNPYEFILAHDDFRRVLRSIEEETRELERKTEERKRKFNNERFKEEWKRIESLSKEEQEKYIEAYLARGRELNELMRLSAREEKEVSVRIERGGPFCHADCICLKCSNLGTVEDCGCPCKYRNITKVIWCVGFSSVK